MSNHPDWKGALQAIIDRHNHRHAKRPKDIGFKTGEERARSLFRMFRILRQLGFDLSPQGLGGHHVVHLFWYLTGDPRIEALCLKRGMTMPERRYAPKYLRSLASTLRTFCGWIGKPGLVLPLEDYVCPTRALPPWIPRACAKPSPAPRGGHRPSSSSPTPERTGPRVGNANIAPYFCGFYVSRVWAPHKRRCVCGTGGRCDVEGHGVAVVTARELASAGAGSVC